MNKSTSYNLEQNIVEKLKKLGKTEVFMDCFTADFLDFLALMSKFVFLGGRLCARRGIEGLWGFLEVS